jgi:hypothetical protein
LTLLRQTLAPPDFMRWFIDDYGPAFGRESQQRLISSLLRLVLATPDTGLPGMCVPLVLQFGTPPKEYLVNFAVPLTNRDGLGRVLHVIDSMSFYATLVTEDGRIRKIIAGMVAKQPRLEIYEAEEQVFVTLCEGPVNVVDFTQVLSEPGRA